MGVPPAALAQHAQVGERRRWPAPSPSVGCGLPCAMEPDTLETLINRSSLSGPDFCGFGHVRESWRPFGRRLALVFPGGSPRRRTNCGPCRGASPSRGPHCCLARRGGLRRRTSRRRRGRRPFMACRTPCVGPGDFLVGTTNATGRLWRRARDVLAALAYTGLVRRGSSETCVRDGCDRYKHFSGCTC